MRAKQAREGGVQIILQSTASSLQSVDVSDYQPRRVASKKWRELIKKVWEVDPLICPQCQGEMKMIALIDQTEVISRILKHLGLWPKFEQIRPVAGLERGPPVAEEAEWADYEHYYSDPVPDYDVVEVVFAE
jgi:hypothetical protein